jgi:hypothetical protein
MTAHLNTHQEGNFAEPPFFAVTTLKLLVLSFCTLNLYQIYWFYQQWKFIKRHRDNDVFPFVRALIGWYCFPCFQHISNAASENEISTEKLHVNLLAAFWVVTNIVAWVAPSPFNLILLLSTLFLLPVQAMANRVNATVAPNYDSKEKFSTLNWVAVIFGGLFTTLAIIGSLFPPTN